VWVPVPVIGNEKQQVLEIAKREKGLGEVEKRRVGGEFASPEAKTAEGKRKGVEKVRGVRQKWVLSQAGRGLDTGKKEEKSPANKLFIYPTMDRGAPTGKNYNSNRGKGVISELRGEKGGNQVEDGGIFTWGNAPAPCQKRRGREQRGYQGTMTGQEPRQRGQRERPTTVNVPREETLEGRTPKKIN